MVATGGITWTLLNQLFCVHWQNMSSENEASDNEQNKTVKLITLKPMEMFPVDSHTILHFITSFRPPLLHTLEYTDECRVKRI